ncbi:MAG TPA: Calx-beta domain-containing protein, partial [Pyrinomonadaceae bacterium]|nr:Calx-beta domain-containing protein [Pyrinomonadaceae bacterium]
NTGAPNATLTLTLSAVSGHDVSVNYSTQNGTALMYSDYYPASGFVIFSPGQKTRTVTVPVVGDTVDEPNENFKVVLSNPYNATLGTGTGVCTITDNDAPPTVSVGDVVVTEGDTTAVNATFAVSLSAASGHSVTVKYATADGTALAASDYTALSLRTMTFAPGETGQTVTVPVRGDTLDEANENFKLVLSAPVNATLADSQGVCTITDNEPAAAKSDAAKTTADATPTIGFAESVYSVGEGDGRLEVTVRRGGDLSGPLAVEYATADATAHDRSDYGAAIGRLRFASGEESKSFVVFITDDAYAEGEESLQLSLSVIEDGAARGSQSTAEVRVADNDNAEGAVNPLDDASFFVRQQFVDIMGREPEPEESAALVKKLNECQAGDISCGREAVSAGLLLSEEHLSRVRLIHGLYRATLGRAPQYRELVRELHELSAGEQSGAELTDDEKKARVRDYAAEWLAVAERGTKKTDRQFVNTLVGNSGLKTAAASELLGGLSRKEKTRAEVLLDVLGNTEVKDRWRNEALVAAHYFTYLRREPDEDGLKFWLEEAQKAGATLPLGVVSGFVNSAEYRQRFGRP